MHALTRSELHTPTPARAAGLLYVIIILAGLSAEFLVRGPLASGLSVPTEAVAAILRRSALLDAAMVLADVGLAVLLFGLLRPLGAGLALAAMVFRLVQAALIAMGLVLLLAGAEGLIPDPAATLLLHGMAYDIGLLFFGVNGVLSAVLLPRLGGIGPVLGAGLAAAGLVYGAGSTLRIVAPDLVEAFAPAYLIAIVAEVAFCAWLLTGARAAQRVTTRQARA